MIEDLLERFLPRFRLLARERMTKIRAACAAGDRELAAMELHALAGEASVLGALTLGDLARVAERLVRQGGDAEAAIDELGGAVDAT